MKPKLIILGESPYNNLEQRGSIPFGYSEQWIEKNNLKSRMKDRKFSRDSLGNFLKELSRSFPNRSLENFDLTLANVVERGVLILNCYQDSLKEFDVASSVLVELNRETPLLALGKEAGRFAKRLRFSRVVEAFHPSPRSRKNFVGSGCLLELEEILRQDATSLEWFFFGASNEKL